MGIGPVNLFEYEAWARERLPKGLYDHIAGGATDEITIRRTRQVYDSIMLRPRAMVDAGQRDLSTTVLGERISFPVMCDPAGGHGRVHPDAELATVRAAGSVGTLAAISASSTYTLEEIAEAATGPIWFQELPYQDREVNKDLSQRAEEAGYTAICLTVGGVGGERQREQNLRNRFVDQSSANRMWAASLGHNPWATWKHLDWLAANTRLPLILKGLSHGEDAKLAAEYGAKAVVVSNAGGMKLDSTITTIEALPEVVEAVDGRIEVYLDGGVRRGTDVIKALALGARAVLFGRPIFWGLAVDGEAGVCDVLEIIRDELDGTMAVCGRPTIDSIDTSLLAGISPLYSVLGPPHDFRPHLA